MKIAYILNTYPQPSHSFIRREITALEAAGHEVFRFAMRAPDVALVDAQDKAEEARTHYVLAAGGGALSAAILRVLLRSPMRFGKALGHVWNAARRAETGLFRHLIYLAEACYLRAQLDNSGVQHLHAHFGTNATMVAMLCHILGGPRYSFTTHGLRNSTVLARSLSMQKSVIPVSPWQSVNSVAASFADGPILRIGSASRSSIVVLSPPNSPPPRPCPMAHGAWSLSVVS